MISGLPADRDALESERMEIVARKQVLRAFNLLQAQNVGLKGGNKFCDERKAQADGVNVPTDDSEFHADRKKRPTPAKVGRFALFTRVRREGSRRGVVGAFG